LVTSNFIDFGDEKFTQQLYYIKNMDFASYCSVFESKISLFLFISVLNAVNLRTFQAMGAYLRKYCEPEKIMLLAFQIRA